MSFGPISQSNGAQVSGRGLAGFAIGDEIERNLLSLAEAVRSGALDASTSNFPAVAGALTADWPPIGVNPASTMIRIA
jgi:hypothetical protein